MKVQLIASVDIKYKIISLSTKTKVTLVRKDSYLTKVYFT